jgi:DNA-binding NarL/FixJ family response regulator
MRDIALRSGVDESDVESILKALFSRMRVTTSAEAVAVATRRGLVGA